MICDSRPAGRISIRHDHETELRNHLSDVASHGGNPGCLLRIDRILAQHKAVILYCRTATRGIDDDSVKSGTDALSFPRIDVGPCEGECGCFLSEMMDERTAATAAACHYDVATMAG
jgi:hypothetical protein